MSKRVDRPDAAGGLERSAVRSPSKTGLTVSPAEHNTFREQKCDGSVLTRRRRNFF